MRGRRISVVFVALVTGYLCFAHFEAFRELALGESERDPQRDEGAPKALQVVEFAEFATLETLVGFHLLLERVTSPEEGVSRCARSKEFLDELDSEP